MLSNEVIVHFDMLRGCMEHRVLSQMNTTHVVVVKGNQTLNRKPRSFKILLSHTTSHVAFSHKKDITRELYYNVYCGDMVEMIQMLLTKEYTLRIADTPYGFRMAGSSYDDEPFRFKQLEKMVKDFVESTTTSLWRIMFFHSMDQGYSVAQALRSHCHGLENLVW